MSRKSGNRFCDKGHAQTKTPYPGGECAAAFSRTDCAMTHVVLLGDSVFDNGAYVAGGPDVLAQLREILPQGWRASLNALDGSGVRDVYAQLDRIPNDATHLVVSAGGNDALGEAAFLEERAGSVAEVMAKLADVREQFGALYHS